MGQTNIVIYTEYGHMRFTIEGALEYIETFRHSENRINRDIALQLEEMLEEMEVR